MIFYPEPFFLFIGGVMQTIDHWRTEKSEKYLHLPAGSRRRLKLLFLVPCGLASESKIPDWKKKQYMNK